MFRIKIFHDNQKIVGITKMMSRSVILCNTIPKITQDWRIHDIFYPHYSHIFFSRAEISLFWIIDFHILTNVMNEFINDAFQSQLAINYQFLGK